VGLIRKTLMISTAGVVRGSSKKQRVAKKSLRELQAQTRLQQQALKEQAAAPTARPAPAGPPAGWFPSPTRDGVTQWWDGTRWTEHVKPSS
jgi:type II secretory pathway pseudopilin PulG